MLEEPSSYLVNALKHLDKRLLECIQSFPAREQDPFRGLHLDLEDIHQLLAFPPLQSIFWQTEKADSLSISASIPHLLVLDELVSRYSLNPFDLDVLLVALAPELDLRYERIYAYLQDDVTRRRPTIEFVLNLLCRSPAEKLVYRQRFSANAPLLRSQLLQLHTDPQQQHPSLLAHYLVLDEQLISLLLGDSGMDSRLAPCCERIYPDTTLENLYLPMVEQSRWQAWARAETTAVLYVYGATPLSRQQWADSLAALCGKPLLVMDLSHALRLDAHLDWVINRVVREAQFQQSVLLLKGVEAVGEVHTPLAQRLFQLVADVPVPVMLAGEQAWRGNGVIVGLPLPLPDYQGRCVGWQAALQQQGLALADADLHDLAARFALSAAQMQVAAAHVAKERQWEASTPLPPLRHHLFRVISQGMTQTLGKLALKIDPKATWDDLILGEDSMQQLREIATWVRHQAHVLEHWGFGRKLSYGKGVNVLFAGPSGTGKTLAAEVLAYELGLELYRIDLAGVVSKYIGETEQNLERIFRAAENTSAILFFDEADALFGKRSEVKDAHDRYANIETAYLLQRMEQYAGVTILASNFRQNLDDAFLRRLAFTVQFTAPDVEARRRLWERVWPAATPVAADIDCAELAEHLQVSGGHIKNIALAAAYLAVAEGGEVQRRHVMHAAQREYQKLGKTLNRTVF
ncbi:MAG: ATP-binding protein [Thiofilum sp.]|uniref:ATP-binding protein n=1 Tax=Thiofilum sp. TaxID=2212733 RepID=UPI0025F07219|nr:ATP-binding protein [Thiofilum sp.]MBK8454774.1 ATP-binding protein [Thiofilum sp.]